MGIKIFAAIVAIVLMIAFLAPMVFKLKDVALCCIILIGIAMMLVDLWQSLQAKEE